MPKALPNRRSSYRTRPYSNWSVTYSPPHQQTSDPYIDTNDETQNSEIVQPATQVGECAPDEITKPAQNVAHQENHTTDPADNSVGRAGSRAPPGLAIHSNSRGGGIQCDVFTKVPSTSKTIAFRVESEETLIQAYRQVKSMNPSASVGGIMFSVAPKADSPFTEIDNVRWGSLTGRRSFSSRFTTAAARSFRNGRSWTFDV
ncbi:hypothetical protein NXS19_009634 [Fusarium pseudograminearum]|nr:hypothetical protein NXS19_009634 [Fusarium pseudograminearum]